MAGSNILIEKTWNDETVIELKVTAESEFVTAYQYCYVDPHFLKGLSETFSEFIRDYKNGCYIEFGKKDGNYTPAFSLEFLPIDRAGHIKIEVDLEIDDNDRRAHRCCFYVYSELGLIEKFGKKLSKLGDAQLGARCVLNDIEN